MSTRIFFAMGSAQILFLGFGIHEARQHSHETNEDHLVLYGYHLSPARKASMEQVAKQVWQWKSITWTDDILDYEDLRRKMNFAVRAPALRKRIGVTHADQIWVCRLGGKPEQVAMAAFPEADIVFCEDGLGSYVEDPGFPGILLHPRRLARKLCYVFLHLVRKLWTARNGSFARWPVKPLSCCYLLFPGLIGVPRHIKEKNVRQIAADTARGVIDRVVRGMGLADAVAGSDVDDGENVLVLGQVYHDTLTDALDWDQERDVYVTICKRLVTSGHRVIWKEHPKNPRPFASELKKLIPGIRILSGKEYELFPIECFIQSLQPRACVSSMSTALFTISYIFRIPAYTFAGEVEQYLKGNLKEGGRIAQRSFQPVSSLLKEESSP